MLTVIIPCYKAKDTIDRAIKSVLQAPGVQILAVDDACPDDTGAHVKSVYDMEPRLRLLTHDENLGLGAARNTGLDNSSTEYVAFLDADDHWTNSAQISQACQEMKQVEADAGYMPVVIVTDNDKPPNAYPDQLPIAPLIGQTTNIQSTPQMSVIQPCWSMLYRRQFLTESNQRFQRRKFEDHDFGLEVVLTASRLLVLTNSPVIHYDKTRMGTLSSSRLTAEDLQLFRDHVARVVELMNDHPELPEKSRAERASHYIFRLLRQLLDTEHLTTDSINRTFEMIDALRGNSRVSELLKLPQYRSGATQQLLARHPYLPAALDRALINQSRFVHLVRLLRFGRKQPRGKARTLAKLGLRMVSLPWK